MQDTTASRTGPGFGIRLALAGSILLLIAGIAAFVYASRMARHQPPAQAGGHTATITLRDDGCEPAALTVPAGRTTFTIVNQSQRVGEWEILDGVMVLEERENIAPGFSRTAQAKLPPGSYQIACGLLSNPRGSLTVTPSAEFSREAAKPPVANFVGPLAEYRVYTVLEAGSAVAGVRALLQAVKAGDIAQARILYAPAHQAYEHIAPVAETFADLDTRINARAAYFEKREADTAFGGFQRIAHALWQQHSLDGQAAVATQLLADLQTLQERLRGLQLQPDRLGAAATRSMQKIASAPPAAPGAEDLASQLQGVQKIVDVLRPLLMQARPELPKSIDADFAAATSATSATSATAEAPGRAAALQSLAQHAAQINPALGLE